RRRAVKWRRILFERQFEDRYRALRATALQTFRFNAHPWRTAAAERLFDAYFTRRLTAELSTLYTPRFERAADIVDRLGALTLSSPQRLKLQRIAELCFSSIETLPVRHPKISVIVYTRNAAPTIHRAIESIVTQDYPNFELIVIDGASTDGTVEAIRSF